MEPLSPSEVAGVLDGLRDAVVKKPSLSKTPSFVGTLRLALAASHVVGAPPPPPPQSEPTTVPPTAGGATKELEETRARLEESVSESREREAMQFAQGLELKKVERLVVDLQKANAQLREQAAESVRASSEAVSSLKAQVEEAVLGREAAEAELAKVRAQASVAYDLLLKTATGVKTLEWSAKSAKYTSRASGKPIPCCPACTGLDPTQVAASRDAQVGHVKGCWFAKVIASLPQGSTPA